MAIGRKAYHIGVEDACFCLCDLFLVKYSIIALYILFVIRFAPSEQRRYFVARCLSVTLCGVCVCVSAALISAVNVVVVVLVVVVIVVVVEYLYGVIKTMCPGFS